MSYCPYCGRKLKEHEFFALDAETSFQRAPEYRREQEIGRESPRK